MKVYTRKGDDGTTGLFSGGRVRKDDVRPRAYGAVDEAQAAIGVARAHCDPGSELDTLLVAVERDLWVVMTELATEGRHRAKLAERGQLVTPAMVGFIERRIDAVSGFFDPPTEFVVPGQGPVAAWLDLARTVVRRAEREALAVEADGSLVIPYLNRLSDLLWTLARWQEGTSIVTRSVPSEEP